MRTKFIDIELFLEYNYCRNRNPSGLHLEGGSYENFKENKKAAFVSDIMSVHGFVFVRLCGYGIYHG